MLFRSLDLADTGQLQYPNLRDWSNVTYDPGYGLVPCLEPKLSAISGLSLSKAVRILTVIRTLLMNGTRTTKRDIYYQLFVDCSSQIEVDRLVTVIVAMLQVWTNQNKGDLTGLTNQNKVVMTVLTNHIAGAPNSAWHRGHQQGSCGW